MRKRIKSFLPLTLAALPQLMPTLRLAVPVVSQELATSTSAIIFQWVAGGVALFGYHAILSASSISISPATGSVGVPYSGTIRFIGTYSAKSMSCTNVCDGPWPIVPGLVGEFSSPNTATVFGVPTQPGGFSFALYMYQGTNCSGFIDTRTTTFTVTQGSPIAPSMYTQPSDQAVYSGQNASFTAIAAGTPLNYQWYFKTGTLVPSGTNSTLTITNAQPTNAGNYFVVVSNSLGAATSSVAALTVLTAVSITTQPVSQATVIGRTVSFTVGAAGSQPLGYQWFCNTTNLAGATNSTLTLTNLQLAESGTYSVVVSNVAGTLSSSNATLTVTAPTCIPPPAGLSDWWPGEGNANDIVGGNNGAFVGGASFTPGKVGQAFNFNGSDYLDFGTGVGNFGTNDFTIAFWVSTTTTNDVTLLAQTSACNISNSFWSVMIENVGSGTPGVTGKISLSNAGTNSYGGVYGIASTQAVNDGVYHYATLTRHGYIYQVFVDGVLEESHTNAVIIDLDSGSSLLVGADPCTAAASFVGQLDELCIFNRVLTANEILSVYNADSAGMCRSVTTAGPTLQIQLLNPGVQLSWPVSSQDFKVLSASTPLGPWNPTGITAVTNGSNASVTVPVTNQQQYFRLSGQ